MTCAESFPLSVIILTANEEANIEACLDSVGWAEDVIVLDSDSTDQTVSIAKRARPDVRVFSHPFVDFGDQRNWALDHCEPRHDWILFLDADERCTPACAAEMQAVVTSNSNNAGYYLTCRNMFRGTWIKHCTLYPSWQLRLMRKGHVRYRKEGHGQREVTDGPLGYIHEPYDHYGFSKGIDHWKARHEKYAREEVELIVRLREEPLAFHDVFSSNAIVRRRCLKRFAARTNSRHYWRFMYMYILRLGFLDGAAGLEFCKLRYWHERNIMHALRHAKKDIR